MKRTSLLRLALPIVLAALALGLPAAEPERPPEGMGKYLVVLWEPGTPVPGKKDERMKHVAEPDVVKLGGRVLAKDANRRVVYLPYAAARQLRRHEAVSYVQRVWGGEPFSEWNELDADLASHAVAADDESSFTWQKSYTYDNDGNITNIGDDEFAYDDMGRLTAAVVDGVPETYAYDSFGNLTGFGRADGSGVAFPADPATNRLIGQTYDAAGNVTSRKDQGTYVYDSLNMIVEYGAPPEIGRRRILYDASDERIGTIVDGGLQRWTIRDFEGQILREFRGFEEPLNMVWSWEQDHIRGEGQLIAGETVTWGYYYGPSTFTYGGRRHYHLDHLGSVRVVTNHSGRAISENDFFPFGQSRTKQYQEQINHGDPHTDGMRFAGHWRDFMGHPEVESDDYVDAMHARYYDPHLGRFSSVDPVLNVKRHLTKPQGWNRYAYVENNPINNTDPTGRCTVTSSLFVPCVQVMQAVGEALWEGFYNAAANSGIGKIFRGAQSGDTQLAIEGQSQLTHEVITGLMLTSMAPSRGSQTVSTTGGSNAAGFSDDTIGAIVSSGRAAQRAGSTESRMLASLKSHIDRSHPSSALFKGFTKTEEAATGLARSILRNQTEVIKKSNGMINIYDKTGRGVQLNPDGTFRTFISR